MAVTPISPPVGEFPSSTTPVRFSVDNLVGLTILVDHSDDDVDRPLEPVYINDRGVGTFFYPYAANSTLVGNAFSILRQGGWASFEERNKVRVFEQVPPVTDALAFATLYNVDLTAQLSQAMTAGGSYTIDGKAWWAKGTLWGSGVCGLVNGSGLRLFAPASLASGSQPDRPNFRTVLTGISQRILTFNPNQLDNYNPAAPVFFLWRMSGTLSGSSDRCYSAGVMSAAASAAAITDAERATCAQVCHFIHNNPNPFFCAPAGAQAPTVAIINDAALANYQTGVLRFAKDRFYLIGAAYSGTEIDPESSAQNVSGVNAMMQPAAQTPANLSFYFTLHKAFSDGQTLDVYLTHLKVMQPLVPA